jgi:hypothetical protein
MELQGTYYSGANLSSQVDSNLLEFNPLATGAQLTVGSSVSRVQSLALLFTLSTSTTSWTEYLVKDSYTQMTQRLVHREHTYKPIPIPLTLIFKPTSTIFIVGQSHGELLLTLSNAML